MRMLSLLFALTLSGIAASGEPRHDATSHHDFGDVGHWVGIFDDPARDVWQKPAEIVAHLDLAPGMTIADLGAGTGYMSRHLAQAVGQKGHVLAVDTERTLVDHLRERARKERTPNVTPILATRSEPHLPRHGVDVVLILDTYHHIDDRVHYAERLAGALRPGGRVAVVDWKYEEAPVGPPLAHRLARETVVAEMAAAGYALTDAPAILPYQYFLIFTRR